MDTLPLPPWAQLLIALVLVLAPSPLFDLVRRLRSARAPLPDDDGAKRVYRAWARGQVAPAEPFPPFEDMPDRNRQLWRDVYRAAVGLPMALVLVCLVACGGPQRTAKHDLADRIEGNAADLERFGEWDRQKQLKIRGRCAAANVGEVECDKRLAGYRETRDALRALLKQQILTIDAAAKMLGDAEGRL